MAALMVASPVGEAPDVPVPQLLSNIDDQRIARARRCIKKRAQLLIRPQAVLEVACVADANNRTTGVAPSAIPMARAYERRSASGTFMGALPL
jgi:hypothetical protein